MNVSRIVDLFEKFIILILLFITGIIILITTYELVVIMYQQVVSTAKGEDNTLILNANELLHVFSFVLLIIIGLELFEAIKQYLEKHILQAEIMLIVALTAISRKVIVLDYQNYEPLTVIGIASLALALSLSYYLIKRANANKY